VAIKPEKEMEREPGNQAGRKSCAGNQYPQHQSGNLIKVLGRLHYRTSYGQNVLTALAWKLPGSAGSWPRSSKSTRRVARRAGLLHDIGKAVDHEFDGTHALIGANLARKNGEGKIIVNAIEAHHEEVEATSVYAALVQASDAISGARPGARREMLETYMQRLAKLEEIANSVEGVNKSYAIQAGRELRIIVEPSMVEDVPDPSAGIRDRRPDREGSAVSRPDQGDGDPGDPPNRHGQMMKLLFYRRRFRQILAAKCLYDQLQWPI
jgi:ribonuclease Y